MATAGACGHRDHPRRHSPSLDPTQANGHGRAAGGAGSSVDLDPAEGRGDWRERLAGVLTSYMQVLFEHPALARSALTARPAGGHYLRLLERLLALLTEGGVPPMQAAW
ncbi:MAG TPA: TetR/AcrR family transcriptional regulator C-terminal domain-containing protein, partial [Kribbella sp.]